MRVVSPQGKSIGVEDIRALIDYLALKPYEGGKHIAIIEQADKMTPSAQNALLKTLESPTGDAAFFLLTDAPGALLSTILSRCQTVRFGELTPELCAQALVNHGIAPERAQMLAEVAQGSVGRALEMDADEGFFALKSKVIESLETLQKGPASVAQAAQLLEGEKENAAAVLEILELYARDLMQTQNGGIPLQKSEAGRIAGLKLNGSKLLEGVLGMKVRLAGNVQWISALEYMYFGLVA